MSDVSDDKWKKFSDSICQKMTKGVETLKDNPDEPSEVLVSPNSSQENLTSNSSNGEGTSQSIPVYSVSKKRKQCNMRQFVDYISDESIAKVD